MSTAPFKTFISSVTAAAFLLTHVPLPARAQGPMSRAEYEACQARDENGFRVAVEAVTRRGLEAGLAKMDLKAIVADEWRRGNLDDVVDKQVDEAIAQVKAESGWMQLWSSLASREKAQELATTAAERVYRSDPMKKALEGVATGIGKELAKRIEIVVVDTAAPATQCMQAFLGPRYGSAIARIVSTGAGKEYGIDADKAGAQVSAGQVLIEGSGGIAGTVVLVVRRQLSNMAARIGQRIVGSVLSRLVSVVAGGIGLVLIAKDIWDFRHGVLPIVADEMKSKATKEKVREELAKSIGEHLGDSIKDISEKTADRVLEIWLEFRRAHAKVVELADRHDVFKRFLETVSPANMPRADEIVGLVLASEGEAGITKRLGDGTLHRAITTLPPAAIEIAREARSLEVALQWAAVAGDSLPKVQEFEIHRRAKPEDFTKATLDRLLSLQDRVSITRLAALQVGARSALFELDGNDLRKLARSLNETELDSLSRYLTSLERASAQRLLAAVAYSPSRMAELSSPQVVNAILSSRDQAAAVNLMLTTSTVPTPAELMEHAQLVLDGRVSPMLLWSKHPMAFIGIAVGLLILLLVLKRLMFGTRPKVVVHTGGHGGRR